MRIDLSVLRRSIADWPGLPALDTLRLSRAFHPELPSHRLTALAERFTLHNGLLGPAHRAGYDATVTARLLTHLATTGRDEATLAQLLEAGRSPGTPDVVGCVDDTLFEVP